DSIYQYNSIRELLLGHFDGGVPFSDLAHRGDMGIGTFEALDGEMVAVDGQFFQVTSDGAVKGVNPQQRAPFAAVKFFHPDKLLTLAGEGDFEAVKAFIDKHTDPHQAYAIRIRGRFESMRTRSVLRQKRPYPPLAKAGQNEFEARAVDGVAVGFRFPQETEGVQVPGYHLHFLSNDRSFGGHVLKLTGRDLVIELDASRKLALDLPPGVTGKAGLSEQQSKDLHRVESGK
ncbi:unnamed protein product, partial [Phaeothamnion confervicola]